MFTNATRSLTAAECRRASNYGAVVERMRFLDAMDGRRMPIWNFVEVGTPFSKGGTITAPQIRAAVWHSIIVGCQGHPVLPAQLRRAVHGPQQPAR